MRESLANPLCSAQALIDILYRLNCLPRKQQNQMPKARTKSDQNCIKFTKQAGDTLYVLFDGMERGLQDLCYQSSGGPYIRAFIIIVKCSWESLHTTALTKFRLNLVDGELYQALGDCKIFYFYVILFSYIHG